MKKFMINRDSERIQLSRRDFLPDEEREYRKQNSDRIWKKNGKRNRNKQREKLKVTYSYWDGSVIEGTLF